MAQRAYGACFNIVILGVINIQHYILMATRALRRQTLTFIILYLLMFYFTLSGSGLTTSLPHQTCLVSARVGSGRIQILHDPVG